MENFKWKNQSEVKETETGIIMLATADTDYFVDPVTSAVKANAPFYYKETEGDFVIRSKVSLEFVSTYDACVLLAMENDNLWAKACFEYSDFNTHAVVSVMTNNLSDDANCVNVDGNQVWLQLARKENIFAVHYSFDGETFYMARLASLPMSKKIMVGFVAQSPTGQGGDRCFDNIYFENITVENIRQGK